MDWKAFINERVEPMRPYAPGLRAADVKNRTSREHIVKISSNEFPAPPFPGALEAGAAALANLNRYPDGSARELVARIAERFKLDPATIAVGNGSNELLMLLAEACLKPGDEVAFCSPSFVVYSVACQITGATPITVPVNAQGAFDLEALALRLTPRTKFVFICNPNNPTGNIVTRQEFEKFLSQVPEGCVVCLDEAYAEFCLDPEFFTGLDYLNGEVPLIVLRTFSKIYAMAGARVGWGVMPRELVEAHNKVREPFNVNSVAQAMAAASLADTTTLAQRVTSNAAERLRLERTLDALGIKHYPSHTNFVYAFFDDPADAFERLLGEGIIVRNFGSGGALRIGVGSHEENDVVIAALEMLFSR